MTIELEGSKIRIGQEYADRLGYTEAVGQMAVIDEVMQALVQVTIIDPHSPMFNKALDIHKEDCRIQPNVREQRIFAFAMRQYAAIYYSRNAETMTKFRDCMNRGGMHSLYPSSSIDEILEFLFEGGIHPYQQTPEGIRDVGSIGIMRIPLEKQIDWIVVNLDDPETYDNPIKGVAQHLERSEERRRLRAQGKNPYDAQNTIQPKFTIKKEPTQDDLQAKLDASLNHKKKKYLEDISQRIVPADEGDGALRGKDNTSHHNPFLQVQPDVVLPGEMVDDYDPSEDYDEE